MSNYLKIVFCLIIITLSISGCYEEPAIPDPVDDGNEPPVNTFLADSPWPMTHRNPYCQASSTYPGPQRSGMNVYGDFLSGSLGLITATISGEYPDGSHVIWGNNLSTVFKVDANGQILSYIDLLEKADLLELSDYGANEATLTEKGKSGAYTVVDKDGVFFVPYFTRIYGFRDAVPDDPGSAIVVAGEFEIPQAQLHSEDDYIVGMNLTFDGMIAFATSKGTVGVVSRSLDDAHYLYLGEEEEISNSIACCEQNGIYVVTSKYMYRVQWTGDELTIDEGSGWRSEYEVGEDASGIRLGKGSGATPTLMGIDGQDKFVVITDGQTLMHLVLLWRNEIPEGWTQIPGVKDRRIAAQVPVTFGNPYATESLSEQSVCVRGYGALVVNNQMGKDFGKPALNILFSGLPHIAPYGAEKFEWNEGLRELSSAWVNTEVSLPNGIPSMSSTTNLIYDIGQRSGIWTIEAIDWGTGESAFYRILGPNLRYNSAYAGTEIGPRGRLYTGTLSGLLRTLP